MKNKNLLSTASILVFVFGLLLAANAQVVINEIRIDQPSTDNDEYFELKGPAGFVLDGLTYLVIGDGTGGSGVIEAVVDLTGSQVPPNGYFVAAESTFTLCTANLVTNLNFENSDNVTHMLVTGFSGSNGDDLDTDDDCVLDVTPWTAVVDWVSLVETIGSGDCYYSPEIVGPDGTFVPGHAYRDLYSGEWVIGAFDLGITDTACGDNLGTPPPSEIPISNWAVVFAFILIGITMIFIRKRF